MNENKIRWHGNKYSALFLVLAILTLFTVFFASGCAKEAPVVKEVPQKTEEESTPASPEAPVGEAVYPRTDHSLDANPTPPWPWKRPPFPWKATVPWAHSSMH